MTRRPLIWFAICYVCGSAAAAGLGGRGLAYAGGAALLLAAAAVLGGKATAKLAAVCLLGAALAAGGRIWADARNVTELPELYAAALAQGRDAAYAVEASGTIVSVVEVDGDRAAFRMEADYVRVSGETEPRRASERLMVHIRLAKQPEQDVAAAWKRGDRVRIAGELTLPAAATNGGGFDYRRYLGSQRIHWLLKAKGAASADVSAGPEWTAAALLGRIDAVRGMLGARMDMLYPSSQSGYMKGLVLGIREDLDPEQFQQFSRLGLTHILAISGLHVAVFMYALGGLLRFARMTRERSLLLLMLAVPLYVLLSGASPSVVRAGIMAMLGLLAARLGKLKDGLHILAAAAVAMLVIDPYFLENISFQLSFIVTAGLIVGVGPVRRALPEWPKVKGLLDLAAVTVVAQLVSFPVSIYYFNQFHALSIVANFILVPFISFIVMPLGAIALIVGAMWTEGGRLLAYLSHYANDWTFALVDKLSQADGLRTIWPSPPLWWVAVSLMLLIISFRMLDRYTELRNMAKSDVIDAASDTEDLGLASISGGHPFPGLPFQSRPGKSNASRRARAGLARFLAPVLCIAVLLIWAYEPDRWDRTATVSVIDVGQGDAIHIRTPYGKHMLIDGGGTLSFVKPGEEWRLRSDPFEVGRKVLVPLLMKRGVRQIDALVISHLDSDHIRGLQAVLESIPVKSIWWNGTVKQADDAEKLLRTAVDAEIPLIAVHAGMELKLDKHTFVDVLWPPMPRGESIKLLEEQNESSVVMTVRLYDQLFVMPGDINMDTERAIIASEREASGRQRPDKRASVLKVAHHGSRYSTGKEWLDYWRPLGAAASVGAANGYGHPHPDTLARLAQSGSRIWRTDRDGEIVFSATRKGIYYLPHRKV